MVDPMGLENLHIVDLPEPQAGPGEVVVAMKAASLNFRDLLAVKGGYGSMQKQEKLIPLSDGAGEVIAVGPGVSAWKAGDRVLGCFFPDWQAGPLRREAVGTDLGGGYDGVAVEKRVFRSDALVPLPDDLSFVEGAALPCAAATAWNAVIEKGGVGPGDRVLIQGTGGVSLFALQFAKMAGAEVFAISSSAEKLALMQAQGAQHLVNYKDEPEWGKAVMKLSRGRGMTHAIEIGGAETLKQTMRSMAPGGFIAMIGMVTGPKAEMNLPIIAMQEFKLEGATAGSRLSLQRLVDAMAANGVKPVIEDKRFGLDDLKAGLEYLARGEHVGKVCIDIG
ncbi:zinc-binding dehydrogenase [Maritimibacter sp. DP07]|uniref:Zinc-binding dehydrogenase n=1 Tax=Maritimibacter harenae TaxID=2606218 RepID=A0A845LUY3_9RHOB|nr:zinc-binding dehydrogenase [Maritimibacter harenae]